MENIFNPETQENWENILANNTSGISANKILCAAAGSFLLGVTLKAAGQKKAGSFVGSWALPLFALGAYRKYSNSAGSENKNEENNDLKTDQKNEGDQKENV